MEITNNDVTNFLRQMIEIGGVDTVDDSPDLYIRNAENGDIVMLPWEGHEYKLAVYGSVAQDAAVINPFYEADLKSARSLWFYSTRNTILSGCIVAIMRYLLAIGAKANNKKNAKKGEEEENADLTAAKYLSKYVTEVDGKMISEFDNIAKPISEFFTIYYNNSLQTGDVHCIIFNKAQRKAYDKNVRVKTWDVLEHLMLDVLNVKNLSEFTYKSTGTGIPMFDAFAHVLVDVYAHIQEPMKMIGHPLQHVKSLQSHLKYIQAYLQKANWCRSTATGVAVPVIQTGVPVYPQPIPATPMAAQINPLYNPGAVAAPVQPVYAPQVYTPVAYNPLNTTVAYAQPMCAPQVQYGVPLSPPVIPAIEVTAAEAYKAQTGNPFVKTK